MSRTHEYRSWLVSIWEDDDFVSLPRDAKMVLRYLKDHLGAIGIGKLSDGKAAALIGMSRPELEAAYLALEAKKPGRRYGWIVREDGHIWVVNGLRFETTLSDKNEKKHRPFVRRMLEALDRSLPIVAAFQAYYPEWFTDEPAKTETAKPTDTEEEPIDRVSIHRDGDGAVPVTNTKSPSPSAAEERFYEAVAPARRAAWRATVASWRSGEGMPQGKPASQTAIDMGLGEYLTQPDLTFRVPHVRGFVQSAQRTLDAPERAPPTARPPRGRLERPKPQIFDYTPTPAPEPYEHPTD